jgi:hypothetical protein
VRGLKPDKAAVHARERESFAVAVDRVASDRVLERYALVPAVPLLFATERAGHACTAALEKINDAFRPKLLGSP